ncbi:hypothetical protein [Streptomyces sp. NPDC005498]|uniref:hypothetical protein n=1 Tax=Streptomyces sp. NPDC005498 TaxID=3364717 RepID=UPI003697774C
MRVTRTGTGLTVAITAVLGLSLATAGPAAATDAGTWRAYGNTNPITSSSATWHCAGSKTVATSVLAQVCAIRSSGGGTVQAAVIVRNNRSSLFSAAAGMDLYAAATATKLGDWACSSSGIGANSWSVCFGKTFSKSSSEKVNSVGYAGSINLGQSPDV